MDWAGNQLLNFSNLPAKAKARAKAGPIHIVVSHPEVGRDGFNVRTVFAFI